jgi:hypothetical protein
MYVLTIDIAKADELSQTLSQPINNQLVVLQTISAEMFLKYKKLPPNFSQNWRQFYR